MAASKHLSSKHLILLCQDQLDQDISPNCPFHSTFLSQNWCFSKWHGVKVGPGPRGPGPGTRDTPQSLKVGPGTPPFKV